MSNSLDKLENYNINQKDIQKLKDIGINTIQELYMTSRKNLLGIKGFTEKKIKNIFNEANKIEVYSLFQKGSDFMNDRNNSIFKISTSSNNLDNMLGGGIESSSVTEIIGEKNTNKTDLVQILSVNAIKNNSNMKIIYIDFDNTFKPAKIVEFAKILKINKKKVLDNIRLINDIEYYQQLIEKLDEISTTIHKGEYSLLIIESLIFLFENYYIEKKKIFSPNNNEFVLKLEIESKLGQVLLKLKKISLLFNIAVVVTRRIKNNKDNEDLDSNNDYDLLQFDSNIEIILGNECQTRLKLKKTKNGKIKCFILNSPMLPENDCKFIINEKGIIDC